MGKETIEFQDFFENVKTCLARLTAAAKPKVTLMNSSMRELFGFSSQDDHRVFLESLFTERKEYLTFRRSLMQEGQIDKYEALLKGPKKKTIWCSLSATVEYGSDGKAKGLNLHIADVSRSKRREQELIESKDLFQTVFNNTAAAITVTDKNERLVAWNPYAETLLGMEREDLFNLPVKDLYPSAEWKKIRDFRIDRQGMKDDIETQICRKDGTLLEVNLSVTVLKDLDGKSIGSIGIIRDITQQKLAERKIRESESKIRVILDNSAAGIILTDEKDRIVSWNKFTESLFTMKKKDLYLKHISCLYPKEEWSKVDEMDIHKIGS
ncbi:MAG: PAS domain S-box protein, partial [Candidatus Omnitrophica bacterium]|nr:PAS domain S-box protein [Candidatus Omnitrophota bacterium]